MLRRQVFVRSRECNSPYTLELLKVDFDESQLMLQKTLKIEELEITGPKKSFSLPPHENEIDYQNVEWFHPSFVSLKEATMALVHSSETSGSFLVTDIPETEQSYGLYQNGDYVLLLRGEDPTDVFQSSIHRQSRTGGYVLFGIKTERIFSSLSELVNYYWENPPLEFQFDLKEPLKSCSKCKKCRTVNTFKLGTDEIIPQPNHRPVSI
jgi:hypothetical protein